jgi:hypothetical protein
MKQFWCKFTFDEANPKSFLNLYKAEYISKMEALDISVSINIKIHF